MSDGHGRHRGRSAASELCSHHLLMRDPDVLEASMGLSSAGAGAAAASRSPPCFPWGTEVQPAPRWGWDHAGTFDRRSLGLKLLWDGHLSHDGMTEQRRSAGTPAGPPRTAAPGPDPGSS